MTDTAEGFLLHPLAVVAHVFGKPLSSAPRTATAQLGSGIEIHRRLPGKTRGNLYHGLVYHHGHGVQVVGVCFQPKALGLQGNRASPRKRVKEGQRLFAHVLAYLGTGLVQQVLVIGIFPFHQAGEQGMQALSLCLLLFFCGKKFRVRGRVIHQ